MRVMMMAVMDVKRHLLIKRTRTSSSGSI